MLQWEDTQYNQHTQMWHSLHLGNKWLMWHCQVHSEAAYNDQEELFLFLEAHISESLWESSSWTPIHWQCFHLFQEVFKETSSQHRSWGEILRPQQIAVYKSHEAFKIQKFDLEVPVAEKFPVLIWSFFSPLCESSWCLTSLGLRHDYKTQSKRTTF